MNRKTKELIVMFLIAVVFTAFDPAGLTSNSDPRKWVFACIAYAVPAAVITLLLSKAYHKVTSQESETE